MAVEMRKNGPAMGPVTVGAGTAAAAVVARSRSAASSGAIIDAP
jgi:hypothetical protein